ncbi:HAD-IC family P-type ATPase [Candidatus Peregrinibacteria bacterium]|nr:HAD-IC family P-type ATPase [Candidatus Peregrinibacteria bacterium]
MTSYTEQVDGLNETDIQRLRSQYGFNELPEKQRSLFALFLRQFCDILVYILLGALALSVLMPFVESEPITIRSFLDAGVILTILILNACLGFTQDYKAEQAIALLKKLTASRCTVRRGGEIRIIPSREILPGDLVFIETGDRISADGHLQQESHLEMNESSLTGESIPSEKTVDPTARDLPIAEQKNMVFAGTFVTRGSGEYRVSAIGTETQIGKIAQMVAETEEPETPLEVRLRRLSLLIGKVVLGLCGLVIGAGVLHGFSFLEILLVGVSLAVSAVPEGLPAVVTVCMAIGVRRMARKHALVRRLEALEALGNVTVICADKTGTMTQNRMKVVETFVITKDENNFLTLIAASCNRAQLPDIGDPTEIGLLEYAKDKGLERLNIDQEIVPFTSEEKYMKTRHRSTGLTASGEQIFLKGAPEKILSLAVSSKQEAESIFQKNEEMARKGLRVLAFAIEEQGKIRIIGLIGMEDPPREGVKEAIAQAERAGIRTLMITGDHRDTARAIALQVGLKGEALQGVDLDTFDDAELCLRVKNISIFARVSPMHKMKILKALQCEGHVVAMTGDGVNDAPALKSAHVGIAMGASGTDIAREAASIVLSDDHYATIVAAVQEGRRIYDNIRKFVLFLLRSNFDEILFIMATIVVGMPLPYLPLHILWINLMTDGLPALALGLEKAEPDIMDRPPRKPSEDILTGQWWLLIMAVLLSFSVAMGLYTWELRRGIAIEQARAAVLTLAVFFELFMAFSVRSSKPIFSVGFFSNRWLLGAVAVPFALQLLLIFTPLRDVFHLAPITLLEWGMVFILATSGFVLFELLKVIPFKRSYIHDGSST